MGGALVLLAVQLIKKADVRIEICVGKTGLKALVRDIRVLIFMKKRKRFFPIQMFA